MSEFLDRMSITDESGNIKKEININFGDPLAREQSQKAMQTSEQAKQTANEAKQIAQEAKDAVPGEVSQQVGAATRELSGQIGEAKQTADEAKDASEYVGIVAPMPWTTDKFLANHMIFALERLKNYSGSTFKYRLKRRDGGVRLCCYTEDTDAFVAQSQILHVGYNELESSAFGNIGLCMLDWGWSSTNPFYINEELANKTQLATICKTQTEVSLSTVNEKYIATVASLNLLAKVAYSDKNTIYRLAYNVSLTALDEKLSFQPSLFRDNLNVVEIYRLDFTGMTTTRDLLGVKNGAWDIENPNIDRPLETVVGIVGLENLTSGRSAFQGTFSQMRNLKIVEFGENTVANSVQLYYTFNGCFNLLTVDLSKYNGNISSMQGAFSFCYKLKNIKFPTKIMGDFAFGGQTFYECRALETLDLSTITCNCTSFNPGFKNCYRLTTINVENWDFSNCGIADFSEAYELVNFTGLQNMKKSYRILSSLLSHESALNCIAGLYDLTEGGTVTEYTAQTLTFHPDVTAQLTEEEIAEATAKGWNIA